MAITAKDIMDALTEQNDENEELKQKIEDLEDRAFEMRKLVWDLAQAQGVKQDQSYSTECVMAEATRRAKEVA